MEIYKYPNVSGIYAVKHEGKIYNILDIDKYDTNSFLTGGIIMNHKLDTVPTEFPSDILMDGYDKTYTNAKHQNIIYDSTVWTELKINEIKTKINDIKQPQKPNINKSLIHTVQTIQKEVDKIKELYKDDDEVFKHQWFMDYVKLEESKKSWLPTKVSELSTKVSEKASEKLPNVLMKTREEKIANSIKNIHNLSKSFEINNNHQMKLFFEIFFNSNDSCVPKNEIPIERANPATNERTNKLKQQEGKTPEESGETPSEESGENPSEESGENSSGVKLDNSQKNNPELVNNKGTTQEDLIHKIIEQAKSQAEVKPPNDSIATPLSEFNHVRLLKEAEAEAKSQTKPVVEEVYNLKHISNYHDEGTTPEDLIHKIIEQASGEDPNVMNENNTNNFNPAFVNTFHKEPPK